jgi:hypothetical protein
MKTISQTAIVLSALLIANSVQAADLERLFAPKAELWEQWIAHNPTSSQSINHQKWNRFLQSNVVAGPDDINRIHYTAVSDKDKAQLKKYITELSKVKISEFSRKQQLPFWINFYNALTTQVVLQHYPVKSIRDIDISPGFFSDGPWDKKLIVIEQQSISLNDIEHRILRPIWKDVRVHYSLNCASLGCPNLQSIAFTKENIDVLFEQSMRDYINHPRGVNIIDGEVTLSSIYNWFQDDFGNSEQDVLKHLLQFAKPELATQLSKINSVNDYDYNWSLIDTHPYRAPMN